MKTPPFGVARLSKFFIPLVPLGILLGAGLGFGQTQHVWNNTSATSTNWNTVANWLPNTTFPDGDDNSGPGPDFNAYAYVTNNYPTLSLSLANIPITLRLFAIGDVDNTNNLTLVSGGASGTLTFDAVGTARTFFVKTPGSSGRTDTISTNIILNDSVDMVLTSGTTVLGGTISGTGGLYKYNAGRLDITGVASYTGATVLANGGTGGSNVFLNVTGGIGISTGASTRTVQIGDATRDGRNSSLLNLLQNEQIDDNAILRFEAESGNNAFFLLRGKTETVAGIIDYTREGVIESVQDDGTTGVTTNATLKIDGSTDSFFNGYVRNKGGGGNQSTLSLEKSGTGNLTLSNDRITYTGITAVKGGTLTLQTTTNFGGRVTLENGAKLVLDAGSSYSSFNEYDTLSGSSTIEKRGTGTLTLGTAGRTATVLSGRNVVHSISNFGGLKAGMTVTGTGIAAGTTVVAVGDSDIRTGAIVTQTSDLITVGSNAGIKVGTAVTGTGIPAGAIVTELVGLDQIRISIQASGGGTVTISFASWVELSQNASGSASGTTLTFGRTEANVYTGLFSITNGQLVLDANDTFAAGLDVKTPVVNFSAFQVNSGRTATITGNMTGQGDVRFIMNGTTNVSGQWIVDGKTRINGSSVIEVNGVVNAAGGVNLIAMPTTITGTLNVAGANASFIRGTTTLNSNGTLTNAANLIVGGNNVFTLDNSAVNLGNRVTDTTVLSSGGGSFSFLHNAAAGQNYSETLGGLTLTGGNTIILTSAAAASQTSTLTFGGNVTRTIGTTLTFNNVVSSALNLLSDARNKVVINSATALDDGILGGWAVVVGSGASTNNYEWATRDGAGSISAYSAYSTTAVGSWTNATGAQNIKFTGTATGTVQATDIINSLSLQSGTGFTTTIDGSGVTLVIGSGGILASGGGGHTINGSASLTAGPSGGISPANTYELVATVQNTLVISNVITNNGANAVSFVKAGAGTLTLSGTNTFTGTLYLNQGVLAISNEDALGAASTDNNAIVFNGGTLRATTAAAGTLDLKVGRSITINAPGAIIDVTTLSANMVINGSINSSGATQADKLLSGILTKVGAGNLTINSSNNVIAGLVSSGGTGSSVTFTGDNNVFGYIENNSAGNNITFTSTAQGTVIKELLRVDQGTTTFAAGSTTTFEGFIRVNDGILNIDGTNTFMKDINVQSGEAHFGGTNTFLGNLFVAGGNVFLDSATGLGSTPFALSVTSGQFSLQGNTLEVNSLVGGFPGIINNFGSSNGTLKVNQISNTTYGGVLADGANGSLPGLLNFTKSGAGVLVLTGLNTYTGVTRIEGGILSIASINSGLSGGSNLGQGGFLASNLVISSGAGLEWTGTFKQQTYRSFTIGVGADGAAIYANGASRNAALIIGDQFLLPQDVEFEGSGAATLVLGGFSAGENQFNLNLGDNVGATVSLKKTGIGTWLLGAANTYTGLTTVYNGTLALGANGALGAGGGGNLDQGTVVMAGTLDFRNVLYTTNEALTFVGGSLAATVGTNSWAGTVAANQDLTMRINQGVSLTLNGALTGPGRLTFSGEGTLVLAGANTAVGQITVQAGTLILDYTSQHNSKLADGAALILGGGRVGGTVILRNGNASDIEVVGSTTLNAGAHRVIRQSSDTATRLRMNALTRNAGSTIDFSASGVADTDRINDANSATLAADRILGGWATIGGADWATNDNKSTGTVDNGLIVAYTGYVNTGANNDWSTGGHRNVTGASTQNGFTINSLRWNTFSEGGFDITLSGTGVNTINTGGLLVTSNVGESVFRIIGTGSIAAGFGNDFIVHQHGEFATLEIATAIGGASLIKNGKGLLYLSGSTSTFNGSTYVNEGILAVKDVANSGTTSSIGNAPSTGSEYLVLNGGIFDFVGESDSTNRGMTINSNGVIAVSRLDTVLTFTNSTITSTDSLRKEGIGTLEFTGSSNATGLLGWEVREGTLRMTMNSGDNRFASSLATLTMSGGTFELKGDPAASRTQNLLGQLSFLSGTSEIKVTSSAGFTTNLTLGDAADPLPILRGAGATVLFTENPVGDGVANINLNLIQAVYLPDQAIPWAVFQDTTGLTSGIGVNNFVAVLAGGSVVNADLLASAYLVGVGPDNWSIVGNRIASEDGLDGFNGTTQSGGVSIGGLRYFAKEDSDVILDGLLTLTKGAILVATNVGGNDKKLTGGSITSTYSTEPQVEGQLGEATYYDLLIHNYNPTGKFILDTTIVDGEGFFDFIPVNLVQSGWGTTVLRQANTYTGITFVNGGVLLLEHALAISGGIGTTGGTSHLTIQGGVVGLGADNFYRNLSETVSDKTAFHFASSGGFAAYGSDRTVSIGGAGTPAQLRWGYDGFVPYASALILGAPDADATLIFANSISLGSLPRVVQVNDGSATIDATLSGILSGDGGMLIKEGLGTLRLSGANTYNGGTVIASGVLEASASNNLGVASTNNLNVLGLGTTTDSQIDDRTEFRYTGATFANRMRVGNVNSKGLAVLTNTAPATTFSGQITLDRNLFLQGNAMTFSQAISGAGGLTVNNTGGTVTLGFLNSYSGGTTIRNGSVQINLGNSAGSGVVKLGDFAPSSLTADYSSIGRSIITGGGTFDPLSNGNVTSTGPGAFLNISNQIGAKTFTATDVTAGTRILIMDEEGNPERNGIYVVISVNAANGTMNIARAGNFDTAAEIKYGTKVQVINGPNAGWYFMAAQDLAGINTPDVDTVRFLADVQNPNVEFLSNASGTVNNVMQVVDTNSTGYTRVGGAAAFAGSTTFNGSITLLNQIAGAEVQELQMTSSGAAVITFGGVVSEADAADILQIRKIGTGTVVLNGNNTYKGLTTVDAGVLRVTHDNGLGSTAAGTTVTGTGAALELTGGRTITGEALSLAGSGVSNGGALRSTTGVNTWGSTINLTDDARINADSGSTLNVTAANSITTNDNDLTVGGAGTVNIDGIIAQGLTNLGAVIKDGAGVLTVKGANTYGGGTTVNAGTLYVSNSTGSGTGTGSVVVSNVGARIGGIGHINPGLNKTFLLGTGTVLSVGDATSVGAQILRITTTGASGVITMQGELQFDLFDGGHDRLILSSDANAVWASDWKLTVNSSMAVTDANFYAGRTWDLIDWNLSMGNIDFNPATLVLPDLSLLTQGQQWDVSQLLTTGVIAVVVPEPGKSMLLVFGAAMLFARRRRK